ncbi:GTPase-binding protein rid1 [Madurella mycetomatis]|uniref:GTPase-binding protein rid1 n=1 Tax=Madurella mycetomatis TaxID=100816 RepID=A0A175WEN6_9PEZI|nr:GTPase-binding protein rid1 [Madurella mycetomatis]
MSTMADPNRTPGPPASVTPAQAAAAAAAAAGPGSRHQRSKSSVLRSLMGGGHKRNNSDGSSLPPPALCTPIASTPGFLASQRSLAVGTIGDVFYVGFDTSAAAAMEPQRYSHALGELQQSRRERSPERPRGRSRGDEPPPSPTKSGFATISLRPFGSRDSSKPPKSRDNNTSPTKPKKAKSATNITSLLRPKSMKNLKQLLTDEDDAARTAKEKDKENRTPPNSLGSDHHVLVTAPATPIYAQFASQAFGPPSPRLEPPVELPIRNGSQPERPGALSSWRKPRPKSFQAYVTRREDDAARSAESGGDSRAKRLTWGKGSAAPGPQPAAGSGSKPPAPVAAPEAPFIDPKDIDKHLEAMLDRRNIPENQRYKMRNLSDTIKMEFIRQDWAEMQAKLERPGSNDGSGGLLSGPNGTTVGPMADQEDVNGNAKKEKKKHGRGLSLTIVRGGNKSNPSSPLKKKKGDSSLGRHFRTKSSESLVSEPPSPGPFSGYGSGLLAKVKGQQLPGDFVAYLRKVQQPEQVEVGKLHKLRLLLRNETVAWTEEFIRQGGMKEIVELLHRIMAVEWREEHEDALLHENLLCLKALCTTDMALHYLHSIHTILFPALLHMIFDPEKKGPSEFTTRNIITSILLTYIEAATPQERVSRARAILGYLRDPEPKEEDRPVDFVLEMRRERPYRVWCKEVVNVTKEVFWIFLHNLNIVALPATDKPSSCDQTGPDLNVPTSLSNPGGGGPRLSSGSSREVAADLDSQGQYAYMTRHFPQERPPVPAAPYVGGVEWDATNYLASHLDLMNAILACTGPSAKERNALRAALRISGWERCLGGSLRLCKEKFYGAVHDGLRTWVAAAHEDGWDVRDVRYGPPPETKSRSASPAKKNGGCGGAGPGAGGGNKKNKQDPAPPPRIEMPKLDFGSGVVDGGNQLLLGNARANEPWLS